MWSICIVWVCMHFIYNERHWLLPARCKHDALLFVILTRICSSSSSNMSNMVFGIMLLLSIFCFSPCLATLSLLNAISIYQWLCVSIQWQKMGKKNNKTYFKLAHQNRQDNRAIEHTATATAISKSDCRLTEFSSYVRRSLCPFFTFFHSFSLFSWQKIIWNLGMQQHYTNSLITWYDCNGMPISTIIISILLLRLLVLLWFILFICLILAHISLVHFVLTYALFRNSKSQHFTIHLSRETEILSVPK